MDLRCESGKKHAELNDGIIEVRCSNRYCGARKGVVVLHQFNAMTGELLDTKRFKDPRRVNASHDASAAVRSA